MPTFEYDFSEARTMEMLQRYYRLQNSNKYFVPGLSVTLAVIAAFYAIQKDYLTALYLIAVLVALLAVLPQMTRWSLRARVRNVSKSPFWNQSYRIELSQEGLRVSCPITESRSSWSSFTSARQFEDGVVLFQGQLMHWLPFDTLIAGSVEETEELIRSKVADYKLV